MKIYTKNGDAGETSISSGKTYSKNNPLIEALGAIDELNAFLGLIHTSRNKEVNKIISEVQQDLFIFGAIISESKIEFDYNASLDKLEKYIDCTENKIPGLNNFIIPGGSKYASYLHIARAVCRRAERSLVSVSSESQYKSMIIYLNRLSDLLFVLARYVNLKLGVKEIVWKQNNK